MFCPSSPQTPGTPSRFSKYSTTTFALMVKGIKIKILASNYLEAKTQKKDICVNGEKKKISELLMIFFICHVFFYTLCHELPPFLYKSLHIHLKFTCVLFPWCGSLAQIGPISIWNYCYISLFSDNLKNGKFHQHLREIFAPQVIYFFQIDV